MRLSTRSRYGLRAMKRIAMAGGGPVTGEQIASLEDVSKKYLDAILGRLRQAGLLDGYKGQGGGYVLSRPAESIKAHEVVAALEGDLGLVPCVHDPLACEKSDRCATRKLWLTASVAVEDALSGVTISDLVKAEN